jgi:hypothetical protein
MISRPWVRFSGAAVYNSTTTVPGRAGVMEHRILAAVDTTHTNSVGRVRGGREAATTQSTFASACAQNLDPALYRQTYAGWIRHRLVTMPF